MDPDADPGGQKTYGSYESHSRSLASKREGCHNLTVQSKKVKEPTSVLDPAKSGRTSIFLLDEWDRNPGHVDPDPADSDWYQFIANEKVISYNFFLKISKCSLKY